VKKILIADDSMFMRLLIKKMLGNDGITTIEATNGEEAFRLYVDEKPDFIILDISMPLRNGLEVLAEIMEHNPLAQVIIFSSMVNHRMEEKVLSLGAKKFVKKPFQEEDIQGILHFIWEK